MTGFSAAIIVNGLRALAFQLHARCCSSKSSIPVRTCAYVTFRLCVALGAFVLTMGHAARSIGRGKNFTRLPG